MHYGESEQILTELTAAGGNIPRRGVDCNQHIILDKEIVAHHHMSVPGAKVNG